MFDMRTDEELFQGSIVQVNSTQDNSFGTGFIVGQDTQYAYVLTCAHVLERLGGRELIRIRGRDVSVEGSGEGDGVDLAILRVESSPMDKFLTLQSDDPTEREVMVIGFYKYGQHRSRGYMVGKIGDRILFENKHGTESMHVWDFEIFEKERYTLEAGYSGSPVFDRNTGKVVGVVEYKEGDTRGVVICISNLYKIWPKPYLGNASSNRVAYLNEEIYSKELYLGNASSNRVAHLNEEVYSKELPKETREELRFLRKKERLDRDMRGKKGQKKMALLCNFADDLLYQASRVKNEDNYNQHLIMEMYAEVRNRLFDAQDVQRHPRVFFGLARSFFEDEGYNETEALRYCNDAIALDYQYLEAHHLRIKICVILEKSDHQRDRMRQYIQDSVNQLLELSGSVSQEIIDEYLPNPRRNPRRRPGGSAGGPERSPKSPGLSTQ
jgi:hypothetical protein